MAIDPALQALIEADPIYSQAKADAAAQSIADKSSRDAAMQRALGEWGDVPNFANVLSQLGLQSGDIANIDTPTVEGIAQANTTGQTSTVARLNQAYADAQRNVVNALASRGMMRSGDYAYNRNQADLTGKRAQWDATKQLVDYLTGIQSGFAAAEHARQTGLYTSLSDAYNRVLQQFPNGLPGSQTTGQSAPPPAPAPTQAPPPQPPAASSQAGTYGSGTTMPSDSGGAGSGYVYTPPVVTLSPPPPPVAVAPAPVVVANNPLGTGGQYSSNAPVVTVAPKKKKVANNPMGNYGY
jgi:hypothetical protein